MGNDDVAQSIVLKRAQDVRQIVADSDYGKCPVGREQKEVQLFIIDALTSLLCDRSVPAEKCGAGMGVKLTAAGGIGALLLSLLEQIARAKGWL